MNIHSCSDLVVIKSANLYFHLIFDDQKKYHVSYSFGIQILN